VKLHANGTLVLMRLGKVSFRHPETMIPRGRPDEITKEPKQIRKRSVRKSPSWPRCRGEWVKWGYYNPYLDAPLHTGKVSSST